MKKIIFGVCCAFLYAVTACSADAKLLQSVDQTARQQFNEVSAAFGQGQPSVPVEPNGDHDNIQPSPAYPDQPASPGQAVRHVRVSGRVNLSGVMFVPEGATFASANLSGYTDIRDASGRITSGRVSVSCHEYLLISGNYASGRVDLNLYIPFYEDGKYIGSAQVSGRIFVSGYVSGNWTGLTGSGNIDGTLTIYADAKQAAAPGQLSVPGEPNGNNDNIQPASPSKQVSLVHVSGRVYLYGSAYVREGTNYVDVNLSGNTEIRDISGRITSGWVSVSCRAHFFISGSFMSDQVRPSLYVSFYEGGRYIGGAQVNGWIYVNGRIFNNYITVSGSGNIDGTLVIRKP